MNKLFKNYKYLGQKNSLWLPTTQQEVQERKLLYMGLYLYANFHIQIRTVGMFRSSFQSLPGAINACLVPTEKSETAKKKGIKATFSRNFDQIPSSKDKEAARFAQMWNKIISSFGEEDLISNREMELLLVPY